MKIDQSIALSKISPLENTGLLEYMAEQGIPAQVCQKYLKEIRLYNRQAKKHFIALGMLNEDEGYELLNEQYSGWINGEKEDGLHDVSFIRGRNYKCDHVNVFFHMTDFLARVAREEKHTFIGDTIVLHTWDLLHKVPPYLYQYNRYKCLFSWMPNNDYGKTAIDTLSAYCMAERDLEHLPMNRFFAKHETIRDWCANQPPVQKR